MSEFEPIIGRYLSVDIDGAAYRVHVEEAGQGTPDSWVVESNSLARNVAYRYRGFACGGPPAGIVVLDALLTGLIGIIVDASTGAWNALSPRAATVTLTKIAVVPGPDTITVGVNFGKAGAGDRVRVQSSVPGVLMHVQPSDDSAFQP